MGRHATAAPSSAWNLWRRLLAGFLALAAMLTIAGIAMLWPHKDVVNIAEDFATTSSLNQVQVGGKVVALVDGACANDAVGKVFRDSPMYTPATGEHSCQLATVEITTGKDAGQRTLLSSTGQPGEPVFAMDEKLRLGVLENSDGSSTYTFADYDRGLSLTVWGIVIALGIIVFAAWRGVRAIIGLVITLGFIAAFLLPALLTGGHAVLLAVVTGSAILFVVVFIVHGFNWKSASALAGTLVALVIAAILTSVAISSTSLRGLGEEANLKILLYLPEVSISGLLLCGFIIGCLGVLNDVTISQASTIKELYELDPQATPLRLFIGAMKVGRDHISSMVYTLALTYTGAFLPTLLLVSVAQRSVLQTLTSDVMATELLRSGIGALALTLAVPISTLVAAVTVPDATQAKTPA
ncbi:YibE/F family protein [Corynebacterium kutscheri]|uniref:YibE/F family protein n=1 Tax=Corynebacterium kutscheri TaxID=35755 RepID=UPI0037BE6D85